MAVYTPFLAGQILTAGKLNSALIEELMEWTPWTTVGSFSSGFSAAPLTPMIRKVRVLGAERWEYKGRIAVVSTTISANTNVTAFTFNAGYRPAFEHGFQLAGGSTGFYGIRVTVSPAGLFQVGLPAAGPNTTSGILLDGLHVDAPV